MKQLNSQLCKAAKASGASANASDTVSTICDMLDCKNATAIVNVSYSTNPIRDLAFWTSSSDTCGVTGTAQTETTNTKQVLAVSDNDSLQAWNGNTQVTNLSVSSGMFHVAQTACIAVELPNIRRYLYAQWTSTGTGSTIGIAFVGRDSASGEAGEGARTAY